MPTQWLSRVYGVRVSVLVTLGLLVWTLPAVASTSEGQGAEPLRAVDVVSRAIVEHPEVRMQRATIRAAAARVQQRQGAFDVTLTSSISHDHTDYAILSYEQPAYLDAEAVQSERTTWRVGAQKRFDFGLSLETALQVERSEQVGLWPSAGRARVALVASQALMRGRGVSTGPGARQAAAELSLEAARTRLRHIQSERALAALTAYWTYVHLHQRFLILGASETRAEALLNEVKMLIANDERPAAEALHFQGLLADRQATRTAAEVELVGAKQRLGLAMGLEHGQIEELTIPEDALPTPEVAWTLDVASRSALGQQGAEARADLAAARQDMKAATTLVRAAERDVEPRLDLQFTVGYSGLDEGPGAETLVTPLAGRVGGPDVSVVLDFALPVENRERQGRLVRERALLERARLAVKDLERTVRAEISAAADSLALEVRAHTAARASVALNEQSVVNQRRRLRSELTTAIDLLITEERLTGALLAKLASAYRYALGISRLRFATASLIPPSGALEERDAVRFISPPQPGQD